MFMIQATDCLACFEEALGYYHEQTLVYSEKPGPYTFSVQYSKTAYFRVESLA